jgi:translocation and assembly module TamB
VLVPNAEARKRGASTLESKKRLLLASTQVNGFAQFLEDNQLVQFELSGQMARGGTLEMQGGYRPSSQQSNLQIRTQNVLASDVTRLIPLPLDLQAGRVDGNLEVQLRKQQTEVFGTAVLKAVRVQINQLPQPFLNSQGTLRFKGTLVGLDNVSTSYGKIPGIINGIINTEAGYNLFAHIPATSVANAQQTLNIQLPVSVSGAVKADVKLTGSILKPILLGTVVTTKPARIDRVDFSKIQAGFAFSAADSVTAFKDIVATPTVGGKVTGSGIVQLGQKGGIGFDLVGQNLPGDAIARLYGVSPQIRIGTVSATTAISGTPTKPQTIVNWQALGATYPAQGEILIADTNTLIFRDTIVSVAGGTVRAAGQLVNKRWQASVQANNVQLGRLVQVPPALQAPLSGRFNFSGTTASFQPEAIQATGTGQIQVAGGTVTASSIQLAAGRWQAQLQASGVQLGRLAQVPPALQGSVLVDLTSQELRLLSNLKQLVVLVRGV